jgi:hypothetical protein
VRVRCSWFEIDFSNAYSQLFDLPTASDDTVEILILDEKYREEADTMREMDGKRDRFTVIQ